jgi:hypothetical protein
MIPRDAAAGQGEFGDPSRNTIRVVISSDAARRRKKSEWWQGPWFIFVFPFLLVTCCFGLYPQMKRVTRIIWSCVACTIIAVIAGAVLATNTYSPYSFGANANEQRPLYSKFSTYFCSRFDVVCPFGKINVYYFDTLPDMNKTRTARLYTTEKKGLSSNHYQVVHFYLPEGATVIGRIKTTSSSWYSLSDIYLVQGDGNYAAWKDDVSHCCYVKKLTSQSEFTYNVTETDVYYFIVTNEDLGVPFLDNPTGVIDVTMTFLILKPEFDLRQNMKKCTSFGNTCSFKVDFGSNEIAIVETGHDKDWTAFGYTYDIGTSCQPNVGMYVLCFVACPMFFLMLWSTMLWFCFREKKTYVSEMRNQPELGREMRDSLHGVPPIDQQGTHEQALQNFPPAENGPTHDQAVLVDNEHTQNRI